MRQLRLVGLAEDGDSLLLESPTGESYRLALDERVRAACRGDLTRLGQIDIETDNPLRPREIQARVRAGESAEQVAASSGMPLDRVLRFAYPVLQERSRVVAQARTTPVRAPEAEQLGGLVEERLVSRGTDAATLQWDAWRRDDGRWAVRLSWRHGDRAYAAHWSLDLGRRALQSEDPAAEQLSAAEFHARTITAVTPLAVAARAATETAPDRDPGAAPSRAGRAAPRAGRTPAGSRPGSPGPAASRPGREQAASGPADQTGTVPASDRSATPGPGERADRTRGDSRRAREIDRADSAQADSRRAREIDRADSAQADSRRAREVGPGPRTDRAQGGSRRAREVAPDGDPEEDGERAEQRIAAGGGTVPLVGAEGDDERAKRATVPSWDDILLGVRRRH
jgi:Protein of unknown function (DUF3071)